MEAREPGKRLAYLQRARVLAVRRCTLALRAVWAGTPDCVLPQACAATRRVQGSQAIPAAGDDRHDGRVAEASREDDAPGVDQTRSVMRGARVPYRARCNACRCRARPDPLAGAARTEMYGDAALPCSQTYHVSLPSMTLLTAQCSVSHVVQQEVPRAVFNDFLVMVSCPPLHDSAQRAGSLKYVTISQQAIIPVSAHRAGKGGHGGSAAHV